MRAGSAWLMAATAVLFVQLQHTTGMPCLSVRNISAVTLSVAALSCQSGSNCIISSTEEVSGTINLASLFVQSGGRLQCPSTGRCDMNIISSGTIIVEGAVEAASLVINATSLSVLGSGSIDADGLGFEASQGPGTGTNATQRSCKLNMGGSGATCYYEAGIYSLTCVQVAVMVASEGTPAPEVPAVAVMRPPHHLQPVEKHMVTPYGPLHPDRAALMPCTMTQRRPACSARVVLVAVQW